MGIHRQIDKQTDRHTDRQIDRQADRTSDGIIKTGGTYGRLCPLLVTNGIALSGCYFVFLYWQLLNKKETLLSVPYRCEKV